MIKKMNALTKFFFNNLKLLEFNSLKFTIKSSLSRSSILTKKIISLITSILNHIRLGLLLLALVGICISIIILLISLPLHILFINNFRIKYFITRLLSINLNRMSRLIR
jgi:hypothetical protein